MRFEGFEGGQSRCSAACRSSASTRPTASELRGGERRRPRRRSRRALVDEAALRRRAGAGTRGRREGARQGELKSASPSRCTRSPPAPEPRSRRRAARWRLDAPRPVADARSKRRRPRTRRRPRRRLGHAEASGSGAARPRRTGALVPPNEGERCRMAVERLANVFRIAELRNRLLYTLVLLAVYRLGIFITTPGVDRVGDERVMVVAASAAACSTSSTCSPAARSSRCRSSRWASCRTFGLHHHAAPGGGGPGPRAAAEGGRGRPAEDQPVHPLRHHRPVGRPGHRHRAGWPRVARATRRGFIGGRRTRALVPLHDGDHPHRRAPPSSCGWASASPSAASATASRSSSSPASWRASRRRRQDAATIARAGRRSIEPSSVVVLLGVHARGGRRRWSTSSAACGASRCSTPSAWPAGSMFAGQATYFPMKVNTRASSRPSSPRRCCRSRPPWAPGSRSSSGVQRAIERGAWLYNGSSSC